MKKKRKLEENKVPLVDWQDKYTRNDAKSKIVEDLIVILVFFTHFTVYWSWQLQSSS